MIDESRRDATWTARLTQLSQAEILSGMTTRVSSKGEIVLPSKIRRQDRIELGQQFEIERLDRGKYQLVRRLPRRRVNLVDWLLACPEKGYFVPVGSESTDKL